MEEQLYPHSIGDLEKLSGISALTLRAWEKRHGFPMAHRLPSGHRRYDRETLVRLQLMANAQERGFKIGKIKKMSDEELRNLCQERPKMDEGISIRNWAPALERIKAGGLPDILDELKTSMNSMPMEEFLCYQLSPLLHTLGEQWESKQFNIALEHEVSASVSYLVEDWWRSQNPNNERAWLVAGLPGDFHSLSLHFCAAVLVSCGQRVAFAGPRVPIVHLLEYMDDFNVAGLCVSVSEVVSPVQMSVDLKKVVEYTDLHSIPLALGGQGLKGSDFKACKDLKSLVEFIELAGKKEHLKLDDQGAS
jgi:DNA-binding transcriptional MerR regulator